jgi:hypothetical protein
MPVFRQVRLARPGRANAKESRLNQIPPPRRFEWLKWLTGNPVTPWLRCSAPVRIKAVRIWEQPGSSGLRGGYVRGGTSKATGFVNNVKVRCGKCGTTQYLKPGLASGSASPTRPTTEVGPGPHVGLG